MTPACDMRQWRAIRCGRSWVLASSVNPGGMVTLDDSGVWWAMRYNMSTSCYDIPLGDFQTLDTARNAVERWLDRNRITRGLRRIPQPSTPAR